METAWREPLGITQGDTLSFNRRLGDYRASEGWILVYVLRGGAQEIEFTSTPNADTHSITVPAATTSTWLPGEYVLVGYAVNAGTAERHQIYDGSLPVHQNLQGSPGDTPVKTFAQQMIEKIELTLLGKADSDILESRIGETQFKYMTHAELKSARGEYILERQHEIAIERARQGRPTGQRMRPVMGVIGVAPNVGLFGRGSNYGGW